ncbi:hypothetical protein NL676_012842 [Syzygium grande]|nr:hypothetical protein NL676_012842 [Syzygium grande]
MAPCYWEISYFFERRCSKQIFSLAVLLSSMFIYNQMGDIDEAALDRLSLLTEKTKDICVLASRGKSIASGLGHFSPIFVWLLRDLYSDSVEDNRRITAGDYLEHALRPVQGTGKDIAATNEIRRFIRTLFPDRECFALVRPLNNGNDLQQLDSMDQLRPEFRSGLEALTEFVLERTRPKKVGASVLTGLVLVAITDSFLEACNNGENPTIASSWLIVEEGDCRGAYESATKVYISTFDRSKPPEEADMREAHEKALRASLAAFNSIAVDAGSARMRYEERLHKFFRRTFEEYKMKAFREADLLCSRAIQRMEVNLTTACHAPGVSIEVLFSFLVLFVQNMQHHLMVRQNGKKAFLHLYP